MRVLKVAVKGKAGKVIKKAVAAIGDEGIHIEEGTRLEGPEILEDDGPRVGKLSGVGWSARTGEAAVEVAKTAIERAV